MEKKNKFSLNSVVNQSFLSINEYKKKLFLASLIQYVAFLITYILTHSLIISFVVYGIFLPSQVKFLTNLKDAKVEDVFIISKKLAPYLLLSMFFVFVFGVLAVLLIFPAIIFFANYALVFDVMGKENLGLTESMKKAQKDVKGHCGQMALLGLAFLLVLILLVGFGILFMGLFSLLFPTLSVNSSFIWSFINIPLFYYLGTFLGVSAFLIFIMPAFLLCISNMRVEIERVKALKVVKSENQESEKACPSVITKAEPKLVTKDDGNEDDGSIEDNPSDYIF